MWFAYLDWWLTHDNIDRRLRRVIAILTKVIFYSLNKIMTTLYSFSVTLKQESHNDFSVILYILWKRRMKERNKMIECSNIR